MSIKSHFRINCILPADGFVLIDNLTARRNARAFVRAAVIVFCAAAIASTLATGPVGRADDLDNVIFEGTVRDSAGAVIGGATVAARNSGTGREVSVTTNLEGRYRVVVTEPGTYSLKASAPDFNDDERSNLQVQSGRRATIDFSLSPAGASEQLTVKVSDAPVVDTTRTAVGETIDRDNLEQLPLISRDPLQLVLLLGGATEAPLTTSELADEGRGVFVLDAPEEAGIFSLTGAPATSNNITIDGLDNNDDRSARERAILGPESIAEVQVITNQYAAEYGRASGGRINLRTRGGTNRHHGEGYAFLGDESLNANNFFRNARGLGRIPQLERREGVVIGGPVQRDRHFFFTNYERVDVSDFVAVNVLLPIETNPAFPLPKPNRPATPGASTAQLIEEISTPETRNVLNGRLDLNLTQMHNATIRFDLVKGRNERGFPGGTRLPETLVSQGRDSHSVNIIDNLVISNRLINQARFLHSTLLPRNGSEPTSVGVVIEEPGRIVAGSFTGSDSSPATAREEQRTQIQDSISLTAGNHFIKIGADLQFIRSRFKDLFAAGGQYTFETVEDFLSGRPSRFVQRFDTESRLSNDVLGIFAQDEWRLRPNVTLSLGARWDRESIIDDRDNFSPRLSLAWDPFGPGGGGKTVVRAGIGMFYNRALLRTIDDFSLGRSTLIVDSNLRPEVLNTIRFPRPITNPAALPRFGFRETGFLRRIGPDFKIPYTTQIGAGIERQVRRGVVVGGDYIFTRGAHLWRESNINAAVLPDEFATLTDFLLSRDFDNRPIDGVRPISGVNADVVRFDLSNGTSSTAGAIALRNGLRVLTLGLNAHRSSNVRAALNAIRFLRPDPSLEQVEQLEATGSSFYHGAIFSLRYAAGRHVRFRVAYTVSKLIDEGTTNTASPQDLKDRRAERGLSLQDQRHRASFSGLFVLPCFGIEFAPIISVGSSRPFNIGTGVDRNLNDIRNDRPLLVASLARPRWRRPGSPPAREVKEALALAPIGSSGSLPRNYGIGPGTRSVNLRVSRTMALTDRVKLRPAVDVFNLFNATVFSFGAEFINRDDADFLVPRRTQRPRSVLVSVKVWF